MVKVYDSKRARKGQILSVNNYCANEIRKTFKRKNRKSVPQLTACALHKHQYLTYNRCAGYSNTALSKSGTH